MALMSQEIELGWFVSGRYWWNDSHDQSELEDSYEDEINRLPPFILLSSEGETVSGIASGRRAGRSDSFSKKIRFTEWVTFDPFVISSAIEGLRGNSRASAQLNLSKRVGRLTEIATAELLGWLARNEPTTNQTIRTFLDRTRVPIWLQGSSEVAQTYGEQLDGLRVALDIAGLDRRVALEGIRHPEEPANLPLASLLEDQIVINDTMSFMDWDSVPSVVTGAQFEDPVTRRRVRTFLANKLPLERQTGADIIYYVEELNSFTLVQYKRCIRERGELLYRPNNQLDDEVERMQRLQDATAALGSHDLNAHRLGPGFCFLKLCEPSQPVGTSISKGKYFDIDGFGLSLEVGPKGGRLLRYLGARRYLSNTLFVDLVTQGWVGSSGDVSDMILGVMENALDNDRSVLLADVRQGVVAPRGVVGTDLSVVGLVAPTS